MPIYQTAAYAFDSAQHGADLFDLKVPGNIYTRIMNPTQDVLEQRVAALEGGIAALALASGQAAVTYAIQTIAEAGDNIVASHRAVRRHLQPVRAHAAAVRHHHALCRPPRPGQLRAADRRKTKAVFVESLGNPQGNVTDIAAIAAIAHRHGVPLIVDNTVPTPYLLPPVRARRRHRRALADQVPGRPRHQHRRRHRRLGQVPVGRAQGQRFKRLNEPDVSYHGVVYTEALGPAAYIGRARVVPLRNTGAAISPFNAFLILQGIETLALRMDRISDNALAVAQHLQAHPKVAWVNYAGLPEPPRPRAGAEIPGRQGLGPADLRRQVGAGEGREAGARFLDALQLFTRLVNIGDAKSLATHPASTTHRQLSPDELAKAGVHRRHGAAVDRHRAHRRPAGRPGRRRWPLFSSLRPETHHERPNQPAAGADGSAGGGPERGRS